MAKCCDITAASLKTLIKIERRVRAPDGQGGWIETWTADPVGGVWARAEGLTGTEREGAERRESVNLFNFYIRFRGDALGAPYWDATETRIVCRGRYYNILSIIDMELKKKWLKILAHEGDAA